MRNNDDGIENAVTFVVLASPGTATLGGSLLAGSKRYLSEAHLRDGSVPADYLLPSDAAFGSSSGPIALDIRLEHDTFKTNVPLCHDGVVNATSFKTADLHAEWCWSPDPFPVGVAAPPPPPPGPRCPPTQSTGLLAALADKADVSEVQRCLDAKAGAAETQQLLVSLEGRLDGAEARLAEALATKADHTKRESCTEGNVCSRHSPSDSK